MRHSLDWLVSRIRKRSRPKPNGCRIWPGAVTGHKNPAYNYGVMSDGERKQLVHRLVLENKLGRPLTRGMCACHTCDTPLCVEETHLFEGTRADNLEDMRAKGRARAKTEGSPAKVRGADHKLAKLTKRQAISIFMSTDPARDVAERYGVSLELVYGIRHRRNWAWATEGLPKR